MQYIDDESHIASKQDREKKKKKKKNMYTTKSSITNSRCENIINMLFDDKL